MAQDQVSKKTPPKDSDDNEAAVISKTTDKVALDNKVDDLLDDIDSVLEENAEEFVASFVQKGGE